MDIRQVTQIEEGSLKNPVRRWGEGFGGIADAGKWYRAALASGKDVGGLGIKSQSVFTLVAYAIVQINRIGDFVTTLEEKMYKATGDSRIPEFEARLKEFEGRLRDMELVQEEWTEDAARLHKVTSSVGAIKARKRANTSRKAVATRKINKHASVMDKVREFNANKENTDATA